MSTSDFELAPPPAPGRARDLWLQHAVGFILFEDARRYALSEIDPGLDEAAKGAAARAIDDALYGLMMIVDGVTGTLRNAEEQVRIQFVAQLVRRVGDEEDIVQQLDLRRDGDGSCMGLHGWREGDFGAAPVATPKPGRKHG